jgi:hypothetical protein
MKGKGSGEGKGKEKENKGNKKGRYDQYPPSPLFMI